jgi:Tfp pilus assembly protein PilZ
MDDPNRLAVQGKVVWLTPEGVQGNRTQGIGVQFTQDETGAAARATIEKILGETLASTRPTHTMYVGRRSWVRPGIRGQGSGIGPTLTQHPAALERRCCITHEGHRRFHAPPPKSPPSLIPDS